MKRQNTFSGLLLIGIGIYFLLKEFQIPIMSQFYSWPTILMIIGVALLLHSYIASEYETLFAGGVLLGLGIHFHGLYSYSFWINHWGVFPLIFGLAFLLRYQKTKRGLFPALILITLSAFVLFVSNKPGWFYWVNVVVHFVETFWPVLLVGFGLYLLWFKRK